MKIFRPIIGIALLGALAVCGCGALSDTSNSQQDVSASSTPPPASTPIPLPTSTPIPGAMDLTKVPDTTVIKGHKVPLKSMPNGVKYIDLKIGSGEVAKSGETVSVQYTGTFIDGRKFDSTLDHGGQPFEFPLGQGHVIQGWDLGVPGMKIGGKRRLVIPGYLAYGNHPPSDMFVPNSTLIFDIELVSIQGNLPVKQP